MFARRDRAKPVRDPARSTRRDLRRYAHWSNLAGRSQHRSARRFALLSYPFLDSRISPGCAPDPFLKSCFAPLLLLSRLPVAPPGSTPTRGPTREKRVAPEHLRPAEQRGQAAEQREPRRPAASASAV